ncbi:MAG: hypothetical protein RL344_771 [Pseudomonadota bacterium]|jgi:hypothetical protein
MSAKDNQENINVTTSNIIRATNNSTDKNVGFKDGFNGNVDSVDISNQEHLSHFSFKEYDVPNSTDIVGVNFNPDHSVDNHRPLSTHGDTITQRAKALLQYFAVIHTMQEANHFRRQAQPILYELNNSISNQIEHIKRYRTSLTFETNQRIAQGFLMRFFKTQQEKQLTIELEKSKKYLKHYQKLMTSLLITLRKYPINEIEKRQLIDDLNLDIKELLLQKKEASFEFRRLQAKLHDETNTPSSSSDKRVDSDLRVTKNKESVNGLKKSDAIEKSNKNTNEFNVFSFSNDGNSENGNGLLDFNGGIFSIDDLDRAIDKFFSSDKPKNSNNIQDQTKPSASASKQSSNTTSTISATQKEDKDIEIDEKIITLERNIIFLERFK